MRLNPPVITNAGPLMALGKLNRLEFLGILFGTVQMPQAVYIEVVSQGLHHGEPDAYLVRRFWQDKNWPIVKPTVEQIQDLKININLGSGEQEVLALARSQRYSTALMDDRLARSEAKRLDIRTIGTLGLIVQVYRKNSISFKEVEFLLEEIGQRPDIWISHALCQKILERLRQGLD